MIESVGECTFEDDADSSNIPCNISIAEVDREDYAEEDEEFRPWWLDDYAWAKYQLTADNFMPRKGKAEQVFWYVSDSEEELRTILREKVLPLFEARTQSLTQLIEGKTDYVR